MTGTYTKDLGASMKKIGGMPEFGVAIFPAMGEDGGDGKIKDSAVAAACVRQRGGVARKWGKAHGLSESSGVRGRS
jgi:hypothetical protein